MPTVKEKLKGFGGGGGGAVAVGGGGNFELIEVGLWFAVYLNPRRPNSGATECLVPFGGVVVGFSGAFRGL